MLEFDVAILGAGVVGLACAETLAAEGRSVVVLERHAQVAQETSSRNSGVLHAGLYHPPGSLKAQLCGRGRQLLVERAARGQFALRQTGKLILASQTTDLPALEALERNASACGVDLQELDGTQIHRLEPAIAGLAGLWSAGSGILAVHELVAALLRGARDHGAVLALGTTVEVLEHTQHGWLVRTTGRDGSEASVRARWVVNSAGLAADRIAQHAGVDVDGLGLRQFPCKGSYFTLAPRLARHIRHLVYPLPNAHGLGIHLTLDLAGGVRAGPDVEFVEEQDYRVDEAKRSVFAEAVRRYLPGLRAEDLSPDYAGLRAKLGGPGAPFRDFVILRPAERHLLRSIHLLGIESPGLTACLAIAEHVRRLVRDGE